MERVHFLFLPCIYQLFSQLVNLLVLVQSRLKFLDIRNGLRRTRGAQHTRIKAFRTAQKLLFLHFNFRSVSLFLVERGFYFLFYLLLLHPSLVENPLIFFPHYYVLKQGVTQNISHLNEILEGEVLRLPIGIEVSLEGCLESETVHNVELSPQHYSGSLFFGSLNSELAREESEHLALL